MMQQRTSPIRRQGGVALLEALIATVLLAIGLLGTVGLQARSYAALSEAEMRAEATIAAESLLGVMATDRANLSAYAVEVGAAPGDPLKAWHESTRASIPEAEIKIEVKSAVSVHDPREVAIEIGWQRNAGSPKNKHVVRAYI